MNEKEIRRLMNIYGIKYRIYSRGYNTYLTIKLIDVWSNKKHYYRVFYDISNITDEKQLKSNIRSLLIKYCARFENENSYLIFAQ